MTYSCTIGLSTPDVYTGWAVEFSVAHRTPHMPESQVKLQEYCGYHDETGCAEEPKDEGMHRSDV